MAINVAMTEHPDYLEVVVSGTYDQQQAVNRFPAVITACRQSGISKVLIDHPDMEGAPPATDEIHHALKVPDQYDVHVAYGGDELVPAYVGSPSGVGPRYGAGLKVAKGRSQRAGVFTNIGNASAWLGVSLA